MMRLTSSCKVIIPLKAGGLLGSFPAPQFGEAFCHQCVLIENHKVRILVCVYVHILWWWITPEHQELRMQLTQSLLWWLTNTSPLRSERSLPMCKTARGVGVAAGEVKEIIKGVWVRERGGFKREREREVYCILISCPGVGDRNLSVLSKTLQLSVQSTVTADKHRLHWRTTNSNVNWV